MAPELALGAMSRSRTRLRVLDPMVGSGTVTQAAGSKGHTAIGFDIDPLAVLISRTRTAKCDPAKVRRRAVRVISRARRRFSNLCVRGAYPINADRETRRFVAFWFDDHARRQLTCLAAAIRSVRQRTLRDILW